MAQVAYLPVNTESGFPQRFQCRILRVMLSFLIRYNAEGDYYTVDVFDRDDEPIVYGRPVVYGSDVLEGVVDDRLPPVGIVAADLAGRLQRVGHGTLGEEVQLWVVDRNMV